MPNTRITFLPAVASGSPSPRSWFLPLLLVATAFAQWLCWESFITGLDSGNYWLGVSDYSIAAERPHAPGYPAFILLCRASVWLVGDRHHGMLLVITLLSSGAVWACYRLARTLFGEPAACVAALLLACNPLFLLYGITTENYAFDALCSSLLILLALGKPDRMLLYLGIAAGAATGFRGTSLLLLAPALGFLLWDRWRNRQLTIRAITYLILGLLVGLCCWLPWVIAEEGGALAYLRLATNLSTSSAGTFVGNLAGFAIASVWGLNIAWVYLAFRWKSFARFRHLTFRQSLFCWWITPSTLFFAFVIYAKGYFLLILPACCMVLAWLAIREPSRWRRTSVIVGMIATNLSIFFLFPYHTPPYFTALAPQNRTVEQRAESVVSRGFSVLLPTFSRVRANDRFVEVGLEMIDAATWGREDSTLVVLDPAAQMLLVGRVVQAYRPRLRLAVPSTFHRSLVVYLHGLDWEERNGNRAAFNGQQLVVLTRTELAGKYLEIGGELLQTKAPFALLKFSRERGQLLRQRIDQLFAR
ncbi:MAG: glycosyltransferase family 39 protein [Armatimonadetes bacterium]|nr:glycosyltransferase family 39 protein [Armatimonadota bacterium]